MALVHTPDAAAGAWIGPRLGEFGARPGSLVPRGFEAYARVLHPASDEQNRPVRWADVADACGTTLHPTAQFWRLVGATRWGGDAGRWPGDVPAEGTLADPELSTVCEVLASHTAGGAGAEVVAALWEGFGWLRGGGAVSILWAADDASTDPDLAAEAAARRAAERLRRSGFDDDVLAAPRLELPARAYLLFRGRLRDVPGVLAADGPWSTPGFGSWGQSPNLLWPEDRSWCLATEIDLDSTVVGGSAALVDALVAHPDLEAFAVAEGDSLMADGDAVNR